MCSYEACRHAGIKFQYCARCRIPVAKRNFNQRHSHGLPRGVTTVQSTCSKVKNTSIPAAAATSTFGDNFQSSVPVVEHSSTSRRGIHANIQTDKDDDSTSSSTSCSNNVDNHIANDLEKDEKKRQTGSSKDGNEDDELETESSSSLQTEASPSRNAISTPEDSDFSSETQKKAKRRLETRRGPKMEISTVSVHPDKQQQLRKNVTRDRVDSTEVHPPLLVEPNAEISMERQWRWASLLSKRPDIDDSDRMSTWLAEVMAVSDCQHPLRHPGTSSPAYSSSDFTSSDDDGNHDDDCLSIACSSSTSEAATSSMASCTRDAREQQRADRKRETTMNKT